MRDFHVGRMTKLTVLNEPFEIRKDVWNRGTYRQKEFNMMRGGRLTNVEILFDAYLAPVDPQSYLFPRTGTARKPSRWKSSLIVPGRRKWPRSRGPVLFADAGNCIAVKPKKLIVMIKQKLTKALEAHK